MGQILDSDWSRENLLRSDWSGPRVALITTMETCQYRVHEGNISFRGRGNISHSVYGAQN